MSKSSLHSIADTFEWCKTCWLSDKQKPITNTGGDCCTMKYKRRYGQSCDYWIRNKEEREDEKL